MENQKIYLVLTKENTKETTCKESIVPFSNEENAKAYIKTKLNEYCQKYMEWNFARNGKAPDFLSPLFDKLLPVDTTSFKENRETEWKCQEFAPECRPILGIYAAKLFIIDLGNIK